MPALPQTELAAVRAQVASARRQVDAGVWVVIVLGLAFTAVNVQQFAAGTAPAWSPPWAVAWLLDPMVSVLLLSIVRAEQVTARWQVSMGWQVTTSKWGCFAATYVMNTWASWRAGVPSGVVLHSVPPVAVLLAAEAAPIIRDRLTAAASAAAAAHQGPTPTTGDTSPTAPTVAPAVAPTTVAGEPVVLDETPSVPAATGTPFAEGPGREGPGAVTPPAGDNPGPSQDPAPDPQPAPPAGPGSGPGPGDTPAAPDPGTAREPEPGSAPGDRAAEDGGQVPTLVSGEDRVQLLLALLAAGNPVTGDEAAALLSHLGDVTSARTGRRLLSKARQLHTALVDDLDTPNDPEPPPGAHRCAPDEAPNDTDDADAADAVEARTGTDDATATHLADGARGAATNHGHGLVLLPGAGRADGGPR